MKMSNLPAKTKTQKDLKAPLWEKQDGERLSSWEKFRMYKDMGPTRSLRKLGMALSKNGKVTDMQISSLNNLAHIWRWRVRIEEYEKHLDKITHDESVRAIKEMAQRHASHAKLLENIIMLPPNYLVEKLKNTPDAENTLKQMDTAQLLKMVLSSADAFHKVTNVERLSRGEPTEIDKHKIDNEGFIVVFPKQPLPELKDDNDE